MGEHSGVELQCPRPGGFWTAVLYVLMAAPSEGVSSMLLSRFPADPQARSAANYMSRGDRARITEGHRPFARCTRAPSYRTHVFSHPEPGGMPRKEFQQQINLGPSV